MAFSSSIAIIFIGVTAYAVTAGPVQGIPNTLQKDEYGSPMSADLLTRYLEDRRTNQGTARQNVDQFDDKHSMRDDSQFKYLMEESTNRLAQNLNSAHDKEIFETNNRKEMSVDRYRELGILNSPINSKTFMDSMNRQYIPDSNIDQVNRQLLFTNQFIDRDVLNNARDSDASFMKNLNQIDGRSLVRNLDQIGGGHLVRNLDEFDDGYHARNLDQIGGGHLVRNLDQIGGGHLVRNLDQIGGGNLVKRFDYSNPETKWHVDQHAPVSNRLQLARNLARNKSDNILRNMEQIDDLILVRN